jgi:hypothetical protein
MTFHYIFPNNEKLKPFVETFTLYKEQLCMSIAQLGFLYLKLTKPKLTVCPIPYMYTRILREKQPQNTALNPVSSVS